MNLEQCKKKGLVKVDNNKIKSLLKIAQRRKKASNVLPEELYEPKLVLLYDSLRIILEYKALKRGYKIYNYECYVSFLKELMKDSALGDEFDK